MYVPYVIGNWNYYLMMMSLQPWAVFSTNERVPLLFFVSVGVVVVVVGGGVVVVIVVIVVVVSYL